MTNGRLEARITIPAGGWDMAVNGSGETIPSGNYYWDELLAEIEDRMSGILGSFAIAISRGENGTGRTTISGGATFTVTWINTELRDLLGYTANLAGASSYLAPQHARALWLATCPYNAPNAVHPWVGWPTADFRSVESAAGVVWAMTGAKKDIASLSWDAITRSRAVRGNESLVGESFQRFIEDGIWGLAPWGTPAGPIRFYPNASGTDWVAYYATDLKEFRPEQFADGWAGGPWRVQLPRLVFLSSSVGGEPGPGEPPPPTGGDCPQVFTGSGPPPVDLVASPGDLYLDLLTGDLYELE